MVTVDPARCCFCGGCVSVCPVEALTLAETRLIVDGACIACGDCVSACPVGALSADDLALPHGAPVRRHYDAIVVGAGPGGSSAAEAVAAAGLSVLLLEKRQEIGSPVRCAEGVGHEALAAFLEPDARWIASEVCRAEITAGSGALARRFAADGGRGYVLERRVFDRVLAQRAVAAGAEVRVKTGVTGLLLDAARVCGVRLARAEYYDGSLAAELSAEVVIAADGVEAQVGRWAGLNLQLPLADTMVCAQYVLAGIDIDPACTSYTIDYGTAPGGYAWIFPKGPGEANVGLGVQGNLWRALPAASGHGQPPQGQPGNLLGLLDRFIESDSRLAGGCPVSLIAGSVPVALPPARLVKDGLMLVGDAARQVDPLTGGGIINAMRAGRLAGQVAAEAIAARDTSAARLQAYADAWQSGVGRKMQRNYRLREKFRPQERADERFVRAFALAVG